MTANGQVEPNTDRLSSRVKTILKKRGFVDSDGNINGAALRAIGDHALMRQLDIGRPTLHKLRGMFGAAIGSLDRAALLALPASPPDAHLRSLNQIAAQCNWIAEHINQVTTKAALSLSDFTDFDLLSELQRRTERRQEELRQSEQLAATQQKQG